jgi:hypothetical protein
MRTIPITVAAALLFGAAACNDRVGSASDADVTREVMSRLETDQDLAAYDVAVSTENGVVTLTGRVALPEQRDEAERLARDVDGVGTVVNRLVIIAPGDVGAPGPGLPPGAPPPADEG